MSRQVILRPIQIRLQIGVVMRVLVLQSAAWSSHCHKPRARPSHCSEPGARASQARPSHCHIFRAETETLSVGRFLAVAVVAAWSTVVASSSRFLADPELQRTFGDAGTVVMLTGLGVECPAFGLQTVGGEVVVLEGVVRGRFTVF